MKYKTGNFMKAVYITAIITVAILLPILSSMYVNVIVGILCTCAVSGILLFEAFHLLIDFGNMNKKKILFIDLDGTLIHTASGKAFPEGVWDMKFDFEVLDKIKEYKFKVIHIITNQGGIEAGFVNPTEWTRKIDYICYCIKGYTGIDCYYEVCTSNRKSDPRRKPNTGMIYSVLQSKAFTEEKDCLMVGDASGLEGQHSDDDKRCAENAGIDYMDVTEFKNHNYNEA